MMKHFHPLTASTGWFRNTGMKKRRLLTLTVQLQGKAKGKVNVVLVPGMNTYSSIRGTAPLILNFHARW